ncbi:MAG: hypothetical protein JNL94_09875, partial [Planctomycetes bacterium]|nr:hypothetical protein [Planctomycetota bacterium]
MSLDRVRIAATAAAVFVLALHPSVASGQTPVLDPDHRFEPWAWDFQSPVPDGHAVWKRHLFWEDNANTAFVLAHELVKLPGQTGSHPEVVLFNEAQFIPPVGVALASGELRKIALGSVADRGVQILVNARNSQIGGVPSITDLYPDPTFFIGV